MSRIIKVNKKYYNKNSIFIYECNYKLAIFVILTSGIGNENAIGFYKYFDEQPSIDSVGIVQDLQKDIPIVTF